VVRDLSAGRIAARDPVAIAAAVRALLADPPSQEQVAANADRFSWEANARQLVEFWARVAKL
jgi:glycosyltransferase involved in cell wall biosynthesis